MSQFYEPLDDEIPLPGVGKRSMDEYAGAAEADVIRQRASDAVINSGNMESVFSQSTQPYGPIPRKTPVRVYRRRKSLTYMDLLAPAKRRTYKSKKSYVSKRRVYKKPLRRPRRVSKPVVRASCSCGSSHARKPYARRAYKSRRYKSR